MTTTTTEPGSAAAPADGDAATRRIEHVCAECGGTNVAMDAAARWDAQAQDWVATSVFEGSAHCDDCNSDVDLVERELPVASVLSTYSVFVRQANGQGTTHVSSHDAASPQEAEQLGLADTAHDWGDSVEDLVVLGVIAGDVEILSWDAAAWE